MSSQRQFRDFIVQSVIERIDDKKGKHALNLFARSLQAGEALSVQTTHIVSINKLAKNPGEFFVYHWGSGYWI